MGTIGKEPVFSSSLLLAGKVNPQGLGQQLTRWTKAGRLIQLRRGLYSLAGAYRKIEPHPFLIANQLRQPSYISLQSALAYYGMIPEYVPVVTSVTTQRPGLVETPLGSFLFKHLKSPFFKGFRLLEIEAGQRIFLASPEKSLLDLVYLTPGADSREYLEELRLGNFPTLDMLALREMARDTGSPKLRCAVERIGELAIAEEYQVL
ncbi:MAG: hypothetical protein IT369_00600 [Candidatus Latescibacteria bacterium]|nr:hypothetical protein [Candidatus Latescibacterota bacterium]